MTLKLAAPATMPVSTAILSVLEEQRRTCRARIESEYLTAQIIAGRVRKTIPDTTQKTVVTELERLASAKQIKIKRAPYLPTRYAGIYRK